MKSNHNHVLKITTAAVMIALTCVLTLAVKIPTPTKGYLNLGDCAVLLSGWLLKKRLSLIPSSSALCNIF